MTLKEKKQWIEFLSILLEYIKDHKVSDYIDIDKVEQHMNELNADDSHKPS